MTVRPELPVLRMCPGAVPDCGGWEHCNRIDKTGPVGIGLREEEDAALGVTDEEACWRLAWSLDRSPVADGKGTDNVLPAGCEFTVHKSTASGKVTWDAVYSGPVPAAELIESAPLWPGPPPPEPWDGPRW